MKIEIKRWGDNDLYTEGQLFVNGRMAIPYTVEYHDNKVPTGTYEANLKNAVKNLLSPSPTNQGTREYSLPVIPSAHRARSRQ